MMDRHKGQADFVPALMGAMLDRLGCDEGAAIRGGRSLAKASRRCLGCANAQLCGNWLEITVQPRTAPRFCPNQAFFASLLRPRAPRNADAQAGSATGARSVAEGA
jgi:hypothetical protein